MQSMTGFGRGESTNGVVTIVVELRTVNNRFRDVQVRAPREYSVLEPRMQALLRDGVQRGRLDATIRRSSQEGTTRVAVDYALVDQYRRAFADLARRVQADVADVPLATYLAQPGVLITAENESDPLAEWDLLEPALRAALAELLEMRAAEGRVLAADLRKHLDDILRLRAEVLAASEGVAERMRARIEERVVRMVGDRVEPARLAAEAAMLADKADISEELARLSSHAEQFGDALVADEAVGRKLDFLLQELNREVNTIGSKAAEHPVSSRVVDMKSVLERMREQAANVE